MNKEITFKRRVHEGPPQIKDEMHGLNRIYYLESVDEISLDIKKILLTEGYFPVPFNNADDLLNYSIPNPPSIFFISVTEEEGLQTIREIKSNRKIQDIFVIAAGIKKSSDVLSYEAGADVYLPKPYIWRLLPYTIHSLIFINNLYQVNPNILSDVKLVFTPKKETIAEIHF